MFAEINAVHVEASDSCLAIDVVACVVAARSDRSIFFTFVTFYMGIWFTSAKYALSQATSSKLILMMFHVIYIYTYIRS